MPPRSISVVDDSDDWVELPHGVTSRYAMKPADNSQPDGRKSSKANNSKEHLAYAVDEQGRKTHAITSAMDRHDATSAVDTASEPGEPSQRQKGKSIAFEDAADNHRVEDNFDDADIGEEAAYNTMMNKVKKVQQTGKHTAMGSNWTLHLVDNDDTRSVLDSAVDDNSSIIGQVGALNITPSKSLRKSAARAEERQRTTLRDTIRLVHDSEQQATSAERPITPARTSARVTFNDSVRAPQTASGERSVNPARTSVRVTNNSEQQSVSGERFINPARTLSRATSNSSSRDQLRRQVAQRNITVADHHGGVPVITRPPPMNIAVAHQLSDEERRAIDPPEIRCLEEAVQEVPRFGFLIPCRDGRMKFVPGDVPAYVYVGADTRRGRAASSSHERADITPRSVNQAAPQAVPQATGAIAAPAPTTPVTASTNYQAPTAESASDIGDGFGGLFD